MEIRAFFCTLNGCIGFLFSSCAKTACFHKQENTNGGTPEGALAIWRPFVPCVLISLGIWLGVVKLFK